MASQTRTRIDAQPRPAGMRKSELKQMRREGWIPASVHGHGGPQSISVPGTAVRNFLKEHATSALLDLVLEGRPTTALIREIDRDPISGAIRHLVLQRVDVREKIRATVPLVFIGEDELIKNNLVPQRQTAELEVYGQADQLPEAINVDASGIEEPTSIRIADLKLPEGVEPTKDPELPVLTITMPSVPAEVEAALEAEEAAHAAAAEARGAEEAEEGEEEETTSSP